MSRDIVDLVLITMMVGLLGVVLSLDYGQEANPSQVISKSECQEILGKGKK